MSEKQAIGLSLAAIISDIGAIGKDRRNEQQGFKFRGIDDVYNALHPIFARHGVTCVPSLESHVTTQVKVGKDSRETFRTVVTMKYRFTASDGSSVEACTVGEGMDFGDKSTAKAMSVAQKYLMLQMFLIPTADIVDADASDPTIDPHAELTRLHEENRRYRDLENKRMEAGASNALKNATYVDGHAPETPASEPEAPKAPKAAKAKKEPVTPAQEPEKPAPATQPADEPPFVPDEAPKKPNMDWREHVVSMKTAPLFHGRKLTDLSDDELTRIHNGWAAKPEYQDKIMANPATMHQAMMIVSAYGERIQKIDPSSV